MSPPYLLFRLWPKLCVYPTSNSRLFVVLQKGLSEKRASRPIFPPPSDDRYHIPRRRGHMMLRTFLFIARSSLSQGKLRWMMPSGLSCLHGNQERGGTLYSPHPPPRPAPSPEKDFSPVLLQKSRCKETPPLPPPGPQYLITAVKEEANFLGPSRPSTFLCPPQGP